MVTMVISYIDRGQLLYAGGAKMKSLQAMRFFIILSLVTI